MDIDCETAISVVINELEVESVFLLFLLFTLENVLIDVNAGLGVIVLELKNFDVLNNFERFPRILDILNER